jgi:hypothetical protein
VGTICHAAIFWWAKRHELREARVELTKLHAEKRLVLSRESPTWSGLGGVTAKRSAGSLTKAAGGQAEGGVPLMVEKQADAGS